MKSRNTTLFPVVFIFLFISCANQKVPFIENESTCPDDGICTFEVFQSKELIRKFDTTGALYPEIVDGNKTVLQFEYESSQDPTLQDNSYKEALLLQIPEIKNSIELSNDGLQDVKLLFGRLCYCKGQTGYYNITEGSLKIEPIDNGQYSLKLSFKTSEVPQVITNITEIFSL